AMGYTKNGHLIIMVVEGRNPGLAEGASLVHLAHMLQQVGCHEALNLDGGGSSCLLINGKETIKPSDKTGQRPVPAVFMVQVKP
ncbi:MAG TPA: phosphodiester glycosidase family protein, partial [Phnomibacter sp.]|nr:phosphodiester glycosidase family protein [Phnomibacter sp.]